MIDASTVLAGPSVGMFFAELGAKVIKIEHPRVGDVLEAPEAKQLVLQDEIEGVDTKRIKSVAFHLN